jgi:hypothetical protein
MLVDLVEVTTTDGLTLGGAYMAATVADRPSPIDCLCFFHGDGGHFYRRLYLELGARLAASGIAFLAANRRGHDLVSRGSRGGGLQGYAHESVDAARQDYFIEGCPRDWEQLPEPAGPLTVGIDGDYVHAREAPSRQEGWFEVIVGKSVPTDGTAKCFGFVHRYDTKPKRRLFEVLKSQGLQANQQIMFLSDGGETVRQLPMALHPEAEHILDWFHIVMRITVMQQMAKGLKSQGETVGSLDITDQLDRLKWSLWHGNVYKALQKIERLEMDLETIEENSEQRNLLKALREFGSYIAANTPFIPNYGDGHRNGETISTAMAESTVNQVISKRFVKKQQMQWTKRGAHLFLQVRTHVLNGALRDLFCRWYPGHADHRGAGAASGVAPTL